MGRAEKRRAEKAEKKKTATFNLTAAQIAEIKKDATNKALDTAFIMMLAFPVMVLHDKYAKIMKKETRLPNFIDELLELYDSFNKDYFTIEDMVNTVEEETGVKIVIGSKDITRVYEYEKGAGK